MVRWQALSKANPNRVIFDVLDEYYKISLSRDVWYVVPVQYLTTTTLMYLGT